MGVPDTYVVHGLAKWSGQWEVVYAGPAEHERATEEMHLAARTGRFIRFDLQRWDCGDRDGDFYLATPDGAVPET